MTLWSLNAVSMTGRRSLRLDHVTVEIARGTTAVLGPSGAGKTSLLNVLVGFERPRSGTVEFLGSDSIEALEIYWSPASHGLWPHLTVRQHLKMVSPNERADELLERFDLAALADVRPGALSLGERSRLSVARAVASGAKVIVMDEPLAHVDEARISSYWRAIRESCASTGTSIVFATHSPEVALREAEHAICISGGKLVYSGPMRELYERPSTQELASMLGPCNWLTEDDAGQWLERSGLVSAVPFTTACCIRPEQLEIAVTDAGPLQVETARFAGASAEVDLVDERDGSRKTFFHRPSGSKLKAGDRVLLRLLMLLLAMLLLPGCESSDGPALTVKQENYWSMPPDGKRVPAPRGMTVSPEGEYLVLDNAGRVLVFDQNGDIQRQWWMPDYSVGRPEGICVLKDGRIAVADTHYHRVVFFDREGTVTGMFGSMGTKPGEFIYPVSVIQDHDENLYVCEYGNYNDRIQKFKADGTWLAQIGEYGTGDGQFQRPSGMAWWDGRLYVTDAFNNRVQIFGADGKLVAILGGSDKMADLHYPYDIAANQKGEMFVVEYAAGRVTKMDQSGKVLGRYGRTGGEMGQFSTPWGLAVDSRGRVYVCDTGNRRVVELEFW